MALDPSMPVLVVDDYSTMVRIIRNLLRQLGFGDVDDAPDGAAALRVTFPLVEVPPVTDGGVKATEPTPGGNTVKVALCVVLL